MNLKGKLLLAHGTMDNNVPPNNTLLVVNELIKANKDFDLILLPEPHARLRQRAVHGPPPVGLFRAEPDGGRAARGLRAADARAPDYAAAGNRPHGAPTRRFVLRGLRRMHLRLRPRDVDAAFEVGAVVDADAGGLDVADEASLVADGELLQGLDIAFDRAEDHHLARPDVRAHLAVAPDGHRLPDSTMPSTSPSTISSSSLRISPLMCIEAPMIGLLAGGR